ncbi:MAG: toll/interleukin-1 receptor domain-containing protein [Clostridia bacterium]|nr:toll/interleukin-1 receptor domain-containing protein [Clostridia bacterium]
MNPPVPYRGKEPYIFISYSHKDSRKVWPVIEQMQADGYRVWYDEGIDPGTEWDENIAAHVTGCDYFIAFISKNYINSENCKDELNFSRDLNKKQLLIYLEDVDLPDGMDLRLGRVQRVTRNGKGDFYQRLYDAEGISSFTSGVKLDRPAKKKLSPLLFILPLVAIAAVAMFLFKPAADEPTTAAPAEVITTADPDAPPVLDKHMIFSKNNVSLTVQDMYLDEEGALILDMMAKNDNSQDVQLSFHLTYINDVQCFPEMFQTVPASSEANVQIRWRPETFDEYNVGQINNPLDVTKIEASIVMEGFTDSHYFTYYPYGEENHPPMEYVPDDDDIMLIDNEYYMAVITDHFYDENDRWVADVISYNKTDRMVNGVVNFESTNGYNYGFCLSEDLRAYNMVRSRFFLDEWQVTDLDKVRQLDVVCNVRDSETNDLLLHESLTVYPEGDSELTFEPRVLDSDDRIIFESEDVVVAIIDQFERNEYNYAFRFYCYNKSDKTIRFVLDNYYHNDELIAESGWNLAYLQPGEQAFDTQYIHHQDAGTTSSADFELIITDAENYSTTGNEYELYRKNIHLDFSR